VIILGKVYITAYRKIKPIIIMKGGLIFGKFKVVY